MKDKAIKYVWVGIFILVLSLIAQSAKALPISEIGIPMLGASYNLTDHVFKISGNADVQVFYDGADPVYYNALFNLSTSGLDYSISNEGKTITYSAGNPGTGAIDLLDAGHGYSPLLIGNLTSLEMTIVDSVLGLFQGTGDFLVTHGGLAGEFGENGGLATIGIAFKVPFDFNNSFAAMANTKLFPDSMSIPDASIMWLLGPAFIVLGIFGRKKSQGT